MSRPLLLCCLAALLLLPTGCRRAPVAGSFDLPAGLPNRPGEYTDIAPCWSHDGRHIAFLRATPDRRLQLMLASADLRQIRPLLSPELVSPDRLLNASRRAYRSPDTLAWSPDDRRIAFERVVWTPLGDGERLPGDDLWSYDLTTGRVEPLALHSKRGASLFNYYHFPSWSPDGRYFTFVGEGVVGQRSIFVRTLNVQKAQSVVPRFDTYQDSDWPTWRSGPGTQRQQELVFRQGILHPLASPRVETLRRLRPGSADPAISDELWRIHAQNFTGASSPSRQEESVAPRTGHFAWSPDGRRLAFTLTSDAADFDRYELRVISADGGDVHCVSPHDGRGYFAPVWIDANRIAALSPRRGGGCDVVILALVGGARRVLGDIPSADCDWSPDRSRIVYAPTEPVRPNGASTTLQLFDAYLSGRSQQHIKTG